MRVEAAAVAFCVVGPAVNLLPGVALHAVGS